MQKRFTPDAGGAFPEWEEVTLGDILEINPKTEEKIADEFYYANLASINNGVFTHGAVINHNEAPVRAQRVVHIDDVLFQSVNAENLGHYHYTKDKELDKQFVASTGFFLLRMKNGCNAFLYQLLFTKAFNQEVHKYSAGSIYPAINITEFKKIKVRIPKSMEEQRKIAAALAAYDEMIAVKTAKLETWQECKKRMVKEVFGRTKRFKDDDGMEFPEWEEKTLGEVVSITTGKLNANEMVDGGQFDFYTSGVDVFKIDKAAFNGPAITVAGNGANIGCLHLADGKFNAYQRTYVLQDFLACREYIYAAIEVKLPNVIKKYKRGSAIPYIVMDMLADLKIPLPCMEEQQKIGSFLAEIDKEIKIEKEFVKTYAEGKKRMMRELMEK
ncbi:MAG: restriction endonuclease subunit S [Anaerobutyricum sp.]